MGAILAALSMLTSKEAVLLAVGAFIGLVSAAMSDDVLGCGRMVVSAAIVVISRVVG